MSRKLVPHDTASDAPARAYAPHCDYAILHAPGSCEYCDEYPDWQHYREVSQIAFTDEPLTGDKAPCPSEWFRDPIIRAAWPGNRARQSGS